MAGGGAPRRARGAAGRAPQKRLAGKVAIVTGGGHGIGEAFCRAFAVEGATVVTADIDFAAAEKLAEEVAASNSGRVLALATDVSDESSTLEMASRALDSFGRIDILINNAAIFSTVPMSRVSIDELPVEEWDHLMAVNLKGPFLCCRAVLPAMRRQKGGKIINIASSAVHMGWPSPIHYISAKAGVMGLTRKLAREVGGDGICVNAIAPGGTLSEANPTPEVLKLRQSTVAGRAIPRVEYPQDLVGGAIFLASEESDFMTGQTIVIDGGAVMS